MCVHACVGGDSENESCRIRFGSETREEPTKRSVTDGGGDSSLAAPCTSHPSPSTSRRPPHLIRKRC